MIVIRAPRMKLLFLFALSAIFVAAGSWLFLIPMSFLSPLTKAVGLLGILFGGLSGGWYLSRMFSNRMSLILDQEGLLDNSSGAPAGRIGWDQISRVGIVSLQNNRFVGIDVVDRKAFAASSSPFRRYIEESNAAITGFPVNIPSFAVDRSLEELRDLIRKYWQNPKERKTLA